ncbi:hypothetical protein F4818DRAFT_416192 [Hypoxylon cercidicola]|nr:hypothetical protein F4818DRAFT_416192 [Hypoxylon cercidicola]
MIGDRPLCPRSMHISGVWQHISSQLFAQQHCYFHMAWLALWHSQPLEVSTPTLGKYFGPPKREPRSRFDDRQRGGGDGRSYGRDDRYRHRSYYRQQYDDRGGGRRYREEWGYDRNYRDGRGTSHRGRCSWSSR